MELNFAVPMAEVTEAVATLRDRGFEADISPRTAEDTGVISIELSPEAEHDVREAVRAIAPDSRELTEP